MSDYYKEHKEECIARSKAYYQANKSVILVKLKEKYLQNREAYIERAKTYYHVHKSDKGWLKKIRRRNHERRREYRRCNLIRHGGQTYLVAHKSPHPNNDCCPLCGRKAALGYHHWDDRNPEDGLWICKSCHSVIHHILKHHNLRVVVCQGIKDLLKQKDFPPAEGRTARGKEREMTRLSAG